MLSNAQFAVISKDTILGLTTDYPAIGRAFWWSTLVDEAILHEWLVNIAQREAYRRLAHLFCELWMRLHQVGLANDAEITLPLTLTQKRIGEPLGLTAVHVNRVLQKMRADGLILLRGKYLVIPDVARLREVAGSDPKYLPLNRRTERASSRT